MRNKASRIALDSILCVFGIICGCLVKWNGKIFDSSSSDFDYSLPLQVCGEKLAFVCVRTFDELRGHEQCCRILASRGFASEPGARKKSRSLMVPTHLLCMCAFAKKIRYFALGTVARTAYSISLSLSWCFLPR